MFPCCGRWSQSTKIKVRQISKFPRTGGYLPLCESMYLLMLSMYFIIKAIVLLCSGWCFSLTEESFYTITCSGCSSLIVQLVWWLKSWLSGIESWFWSGWFECSEFIAFDAGSSGFSNCKRDETGDCLIIDYKYILIKRQLYIPVTLRISTTNSSWSQRRPTSVGLHRPPLNTLQVQKQHARSHRAEVGGRNRMRLTN